MLKKIGKKRMALRALLLQSAVVGFAAIAARADSYVYQEPGNGNWNSTDAWYDLNTDTNANFPTDDGQSIAEVDNEDSTGVTNSNIQFNQTYTAGRGLSLLEVSSGNTLTQSGAGTAMYSDEETLGQENGAGTYTQSAGSNVIIDSLNIGEESSGTYNLSGNGSVSASDISIGSEESGSFFNQSGGSVTVSDDLSVGAEGESALSQYNQTGGTNTISGTLTVGGYSAGLYSLAAPAILSVTGSEIIGQDGFGIFVQSGGTHTIAGTLSIGAESGGTFNLNGGTLTASFEQIGGEEGSAFNQNGGSQTIANDLSLNGGFGSPSTMSLNSGTTTVNGNAYIGGIAAGSGDPGVLFIDGGELSVANTLTVYSNASLISLTAGTLSVGTLNTSGNPGSLVWTGGTLALGGNLDFISSFPDPYNSNPLGSAPLTLGSTQNLNVFNWEWLADSGDMITQLAGSTNTCAFLYAGSAGTPASYNLEGGTLTVSAFEWIGYSDFDGRGGAFVFNQSGGTNNTPELVVGYNQPGTYMMSGGTLNAGVTVNNDTIIQTGGVAAMGNLTGTGNITIGAGSSSATMTATGLQQNDVTINHNGKLTLNGAGFNNTVSNLVVSGGGVLDITNSQLIINYGASADPVATIYADIKSAYNGGLWNGPGITSSTAALPANNAHYGVGLVDGKDHIPGATVASGQLEIAYALYGDVNLDGLVNATDFAVFGANFNKSVTGWEHGDFTYSGLINGTDFALLGENFGKSAVAGSVQLPASDWAALDAFAAANGLALPNVPEPASVGLIAIAALGALGRRRRRA